VASLDRRLHAFRSDLADAALKGQVDAERFTTGQAAVVCVDAADLRAEPKLELGIDTQLLFGEAVTCLEVRDGWAWVKNQRDGYVGYLPAKTLDVPSGEPTHQVSALRTFRYPEANMKRPVLGALSMTSPVRVLRQEGTYSEIASGGWVYSDHLALWGDSESDHVKTALRFLGQPYRWGGKESVGLDCSALVQMALHRAGLACPRDSDMQAGVLGDTAPGDDDICRGDLLFMPGHVAIALDEARVLHATESGMRVRVEPLRDLLARVEAEFGCGVTRSVRLPARPRSD
jgi:cell wall-associated NlpC family hydrolase